MPRPERKPLLEDGPQTNLLVVEGPDDFFAFKSLLEAHKLLGRFRMADGGGYERLRSSIATRIDETGLERIGFVVDADESRPNRWQSVMEALSEAGYTALPAEPDKAGSVIAQAEKPTVGVWLMPDNENSGALENFIRFLIPDGDLLWDHAVNSVANLPKLPDDPTDNWTSKAHIHTWLAWQQEPGKPIGQAITKRFLNPRTDEAQRLVGWMRRLFALDAAAR